MSSDGSSIADWNDSLDTESNRTLSLSTSSKANRLVNEVCDGSRTRFLRSNTERMFLIDVQD